MGLSRQLHLDGVTGEDYSTLHDDGHHAGFADEPAGLVSIENGPEQTWLETIDLTARVSEAREFQRRFSAEDKTRSYRKVEERDALRRDVLAHLSRIDGKPLSPKLPKKLQREKVHLAKVWRRRVSACP